MLPPLFLTSHVLRPWISHVLYGKRFTICCAIFLDGDHPGLASHGGMPVENPYSILRTSGWFANSGIATNNLITTQRRASGKAGSPRLSIH
jgi:hypothetical protein